MSAENNAEATAPTGSRPEGNRARAAFEEYKRRMEALSARMTGGMPMGANQPYPPPYPYGPPGWIQPPSPGMAAPAGWIYPPPPGMAAPPSGPPHTRPGHAGMSKGATPSLFDSIGNLVRLGVEIVNLGLTGGMQIMEGLSGAPAYGYDQYWHSPPHPHLHQGYHGHHGGYGCCCEPFPGYCGCNPSVHNCY